MTWTRPYKGSEITRDPGIPEGGVNRCVSAKPSRSHYREVVVHKTRTLNLTPIENATKKHRETNDQKQKRYPVV